MRLVNKISVCVAALFLSSISFADSVKFDGSVVAPGSRLVAGDLSQNEFYILGKDEHMPVKVTTHQVRMALHRSKSSSVDAALKVAMKKHHQRFASKKNMEKIHVALESSFHKAKGKKASASMRMAAKRHHHQMAKRHVKKNKVVAHRDTHQSRVTLPPVRYSANDVMKTVVV